MLHVNASGHDMHCRPYGVRPWQPCCLCIQLLVDYWRQRHHRQNYEPCFTPKSDAGFSRLPPLEIALLVSSLHVLDRQKFFDADDGDFWRLGLIVKLATSPTSSGDLRPQIPGNPDFAQLSQLWRAGMQRQLPLLPIAVMSPAPTSFGYFFPTTITMFSRRFRFMFDYSDYYCRVDVNKVFLRISNDAKRLFVLYKPPLHFTKRFLTLSSNKFSSSSRVLSYRQSLLRSNLVI